MKQAYYAAALANFLKEQPATVLGHLAAQHAHSLDPLQRNAWLSKSHFSRRRYANWAMAGIALEFAIPPRRRSGMAPSEGVALASEKGSDLDAI